MRSSRTAAARSAALAAHVFHPADRSRWTKWLSDQRRLSRLRTTSRHCATQPAHPRDSSRCIRCRSALDTLSRRRCASTAAAHASSQLRKPLISLRLTRDKRLRCISSIAPDRFIAIATHVFHPADRPRKTRWLTARRMLSRPRAIC